MLTTSHFIGVKILPDMLADLFVKVQDIFKDDPSVIEFQNPLSTHISLYYLPSSISSEKLIHIQNVLHECNQKKTTWSLTWSAYFWETESPRLIYLVPDNYDILSQLHHHLKSIFPEFLEVLDNQYPDFVPHMTFFTIKDARKFSIKQKDVEKIISEELEEVKNKNVFGEIYLYKVNSRFNPEIQVQIS